MERCAECHAKCSLIEREKNRCRCTHLFCSKHIVRVLSKSNSHTVGHVCTFNYKKENQERIRDNNPAVLPERLSL
jgi:hypothetical protein